MSALAVRTTHFPQLSWPRVGAWSGTFSIHLLILALLLMPAATLQIVRRAEPMPDQTVVIHPEIIQQVAEPALPEPVHPVITKATPHHDPVPTVTPIPESTTGPVVDTVAVDTAPPAIDISRVIADSAPAAITYGDRTHVPYPRDALLMREQGTVTLRVVVAADGTVESVEIATSSGSPRLDRAARDAVRRWTFHPAIRDGVPHQGIALVPISFSLQQL